MNIDKSKIKFQTYSWVIGTTSFRVSETKYKIEKQLIILDSFRQPLNNIKWRDLQDEYFNYLVKNGLAKNKDNISNRKKDARQISASLEFIGLVDKERFLKETGYKILEILEDRNFNFANIFGVRNDSFFYIKQYLKLEFSDNIGNSSYKNFKIQPFLALIYSILKSKNNLSKDFFTYILPTIKHYDELRKIINKDLNLNIDKHLLSKISSMPNYQEALNYFIQSEKTEEIFLIDNIFMNMNGGKNDLKFLDFYKSLLNYNTAWSVEKKRLFILNIKFPSTGKNKFFYQLIFNRDRKPTKNQIDNNFINNFESSLIFTYSTSFDKNFFYLVHLSKWKINLEEYYDLNRRFLSLTDICKFNNQYISLDEVAYSIFESIEDNILNTAFTESTGEYFAKLHTVLDLQDISEIFIFNKEKLLTKLRAKYPQINIFNNITEEIRLIKKEYLKSQFDRLIKNNFSNEQLINLFSKIQKRDDSNILKYLEWDSDIPTIFEYLIGIFWYKISNQEGNLTEFLNLSLDSNLLPRRFAGGGQADIIYKYKDHHILLEATLSDKNTQRKMELEPVSRHLGQYKIKNGENHYAVFIAPYLDPNVLVSFRSYKHLIYYNPLNTDEFTSSLKIIPLDIDDIIVLLKNNDKSYKDLRLIFNITYMNNIHNGFIWRETTLKPWLRNPLVNKEKLLVKDVLSQINFLIRKKPCFLLLQHKKNRFLQKQYQSQITTDMESLLNDKTQILYNLIHFSILSNKSKKNSYTILCSFKDTLQDLCFEMQRINSKLDFLDMLKKYISRFSDLEQKWIDL